MIFTLPLRPLLPPSSPNPGGPFKWQTPPAALHFDLMESNRANKKVQFKGLSHASSKKVRAQKARVFRHSLLCSLARCSLARALWRIAGASQSESHAEAILIRPVFTTATCSFATAIHRLIMAG